MKAPDCRHLACSSVGVPEEEVLGKAGEALKAPEFSSGTRERAQVTPKAIGRRGCKLIERKVLCVACKIERKASVLS